MDSSKGVLWGVAAVAVVALILAGFTLTQGGLATPTSVQPTKRTIYMIAAEPKGGTTVDQEPFPTTPLPSGGGYILKAPDDTGRWEVSTYRWDPSLIVVHQGDEVTLQVLGVNGALHPARIEGYNLSFEVKRGQLSTVSFVADKVGTFQILCSAHQPSMTGWLVVLPRQ
jgi:plastocyanin